MNESAARPDATLEARFREGLALHRGDELNEAEGVFEEVARRQPNHFGAHYMLGLVALRTGRAARSADFIARAIALDPGIPTAHGNLGTALLNLGRLNEALACFAKALELDPGQMEAWYNSGIAQLKLNRAADAVVSFERAIALKPDHAQAWFQRGMALTASRRPDAAMMSFDRALRLRPDDVEAHHRRGTLLLAARRFEEAIASLATAVALRPDFAEAYNDLGVALTNLTRFDDAILNFREATRLRPDFAQAHNNLGGALWYCTRIEEAIQSYDRAIALRPDYPEPYNNRGAAMADLLRIEHAIADYDRAIRLRPSYAEAQCNKGTAFLQIGRLDLGCELYEWRMKVDGLGEVRGFDQPQWRGGQSIAGKTLFIHPEYGLGDTIQFCRYASLARAAGARVVMEVQQPLFTLVRDSCPGIEVIPPGAPPGQFDFQCAVMSLALAFGTTLETIPAGPPYLRAGETYLNDWAARLPPKTKPRVGLVWSGNPHFKNDHNRSIGVATYLPLLDVEREWFCLQKEVRPRDAAVLEGDDRLRFVGPELRDFSDTAALVELLDLVITIDSSVAHLAGAMGKDVWLLLPFHPDWRWLLDRDDTPWYPSMKLFRQRKPGDWAGVIERVAAALRAMD